MEKASECIILSAGQSRRMGRHKALLTYSGPHPQPLSQGEGSKEENFLEHIIGVYERAGVERITLVLNPEIDFESDRENVHVVKNYFPELGRMYSLMLAEQNLREESAFYFIQNIDNPFVTEELIENLFEHRSEFGYAVPVYDGKGGHPVLVSKNILQRVGEHFAKGITLQDLLRQFYDPVNVRVDDERVLANINTEEEYRKYFEEELVAS